MAAKRELSLFRVATSGFRVLPDFIIIGAPKCGTTSLYQYLSGHPGVAPATKKEVRYFDEAFDYGTRWYRAHFPTLPYRLAVEALTGRRIVVGEASPLYMGYPYVAERVRSLLPGAKLIALLRDPVERAYSGYQMQVRRGKEVLPVAAAIDREAEQLARAVDRLPRRKTSDSPAPKRGRGYLARGIYADQLAAWFRLFPREQFLILSSEDFFRDTSAVFSQVLDFLGLAPWQPARFDRYNAAKYSGLDPATRRRLVEYFAPHNERLYQLVGRDFGWPR
jgi:hypothetical protein